MFIAAMLPLVSAQGTEPVIYVEPGVVETLDCRFHFPVVGEAVGVETYTSVVGEAVGVETWTSVENETIGVGDGSTTEFSLANTPVGEDTETVYFDGKVTHRKYTIDYWTGTITFQKPPRDGVTITADYQFGNLEFGLAEPPVVPESETIYVDTVAQTRDMDYTIDFWTGAITFLYLPSDGAIITADYTSYIGEFSLASPPVDYESETIYVDGVPQTRYVDYTIVDKTGVVTFLYVPSDSAVITADYSYWSDVFSVDIMVADVTDLWTAGFTVDYAPYAKIIIAIEVIKGDFLDQDGYNTLFVKKIDTLRGTVKIGYSRMAGGWPPKPIKGADGDGRLATIKFKIVSAGNSPIDLVDVGLVDSTGAPMVFLIGNGAYFGPTADLIMGHIGKRNKKVGDTQYFGTKVKSLASVPIEVRTHWDMYRLEDGQRLQIYSGQIYTGFGPIDYQYVYVDEFNEWYYEWNNPPENLFGEPDGNYIEAADNALWASLYSFTDITLGDRLIGDLILEGYSQYPGGANEAVDIDVYCIDPVPFSWFGSLYGTENWAWGGVRWTDDTMMDAVPALGTEEGLNGLTILVYAYHPDAANPIRLDSLRVRVEFSKFNPVFPEIFVAEPGENLEMPEAYWTLKSYDVGTWITTLTCDYRYAWTDEDGYHATAWIPSEKVRTYTWSVS